MKIVQTNKAYYPKVGGIETTITTLSEGLVRDHSASVDVLTCSNDISFKSLNKIMNGVNIKYLHTYGFMHSLPISPGYFRALSFLSGDILHIHEPFPLADLSLQLFPKIKKNFSKIIVSWHSDIIRQKWVLSFYGKYIHKFLSNVDKIIVSNPQLIKNSDFLPQYQNKCEVIPIGTNLNWVNSNENQKNNLDLRGIDNKGAMILFVGRLVYYKGIEYLVQAMKSVPGAFLIVIGSGPFENNLKREINDLGLGERIKIIPEVETETLHNYFKSCDLLVLPSVEKSETYGIVQIEAMACGKPVICTELGTGTSFINQDGITGLVVPPRDPKSLAEAIIKLVNSKELRSAFGDKGKERAFNEFDSHKMVKRIYNLYEKALGS